MINSKYFRVPKKKEPLQEHEIHLTSKQDPINFLKYAIFLFEKRNLPYIKFKASGSAIAGLVNISEILKKVVPGVHQINRIYTLKYEQDYEPKEKGLDHVTIVRNVPILEISFYKELPDLEMDKLPGFQRALKPEIFDRVKINFNNVIRKRNKGVPSNNSRVHSVRDNRTSYDNYSKRTYNPGFRGGKTMSRGGASSVHSGFKPGFRGGRGGFGIKQGRGGYQGQGERTGLKSGFRGGRGGNRGGRGGYSGHSNHGGSYNNHRGNYNNHHSGGYNNHRHGGGNVVYNDFNDHHSTSTYKNQDRDDDDYSKYTKEVLRDQEKHKRKYENQ